VWLLAVCLLLSTHRTFVFATAQLSCHSLLHMILPFITPFNYIIFSLKTRSSAYNSHGNATLNSLDKASMAITNSKELNAEPWCIPTFTSKTITITINCSYNCFCTSIHRHNHSSTLNLRIAHLITSLGTPSKAFSKSTKSK